jgi:hypothetical protein
VGVELQLVFLKEAKVSKALSTPDCQQQASNITNETLDML